MKEEANFIADAPRPQAGAKRNEVIVMHPDQIAPVYDWRQLLGETSIDPSVAFGGFQGKVREIETIMVDRPQNLIRKSEILLVAGFFSGTNMISRVCN
jgi:hypothetical protein